MCPYLIFCLWSVTFLLLSTEGIKWMLRKTFQYRSHEIAFYPFCKISLYNHILHCSCTFVRFIVFVFVLPTCMWYTQYQMNGAERAAQTISLPPSWGRAHLSWWCKTQQVCSYLLQLQGHWIFVLSERHGRQEQQILEDT